MECLNSLVKLLLEIRCVRYSIDVGTGGRKQRSLRIFQLFNWPALPALEEDPGQWQVRAYCQTGRIFLEKGRGKSGQNSS